MIGNTLSGSKPPRNFIVSVFTGFVVGFFLAFVWLNDNSKNHPLPSSYYSDFHSSYILNDHNSIPANYSFGHLHHKKSEWKNFSISFQFNQLQNHLFSEETFFSRVSFLSDGFDVADVLYDQVRVLCWVMTNPKNHVKKALHVKATWGRRCNKILFMSSEYDATLPTVKLNVEEGRDHLWAKTRSAFSYVYQKYFNEADWFLKADDDTYVIVENLRYFLSTQNSSTPIYFGCRFKPYVKQGYMSGGKKQCMKNYSYFP